MEETDRLCKLWTDTDWAREAEKTEGVDPEDLRVITETDMASVCAMGLDRLGTASVAVSESKTE